VTSFFTGLSKVLVEDLALGRDAEINTAPISNRRHLDAARAAARGAKSFSI